MKLLIYGAGGQGKTVADAAIKSGAYKQVAFAADGVQSVLGLPVVCGFDDIAADFKCAIAALGNNFLRMKKTAALKRAGYAIACIIHPSAILGTGCAVAPGCMINANAVLGVNARIGESCLINTGAMVEHDCALGAYVHVAPGAKALGNATIGACVTIGAGSVILPGVIVPEGCIIGAGAVVTHNLSQAGTYVGIPARLVSA